VARLYGGSGGFLWRSACWARGVLRDGGRLLSGLALAAFALYAAWPAPCGPPCAQRLYWLGVAIGCLLLVPALKRYSRTSCPLRPGAYWVHASHVQHWVASLYKRGPGHCFPSGHAVAALAFVALYFPWRDHHATRARWVLATVVALGLLFGCTQTARGAHFPSHAMWSPWLCWAGCAVAAWHAQCRAALATAYGCPAGHPLWTAPHSPPTRHLW
jgi:membrane-associated PAP2 superfamily phosphatase